LVHVDDVTQRPKLAEKMQSPPPLDAPLQREEKEEDSRAVGTAPAPVGHIKKS
jgi:hypothetical protein